MAPFTMPELKPRVLGTSRESAPVNWALHQTSSYLTGELFTGGYYRDCLNIAEGMAASHRPGLEAIHAARKSTNVDVERLIAHLEDVSRWAAAVRKEDYHTVNTHVFVTLWAAQEAGIENVLAAILQTDRPAAEMASAKFPATRFPMAAWPWPESACLELAQRLESKAKDLTPGGGTDVAKRTSTLLSWFDLNVELEAAKSRTYSEASMVRNVILHRYGYLGPKEVEAFPELAEWLNAVLPITTLRLRSYHAAVLAMHLALAKAIWASRYK